VAVPLRGPLEVEASFPRGGRDALAGAGGPRPRGVARGLGGRSRDPDRRGA